MLSHKLKTSAQFISRINLTFKQQTIFNFLSLKLKYKITRKQLVVTISTGNYLVKIDEYTVCFFFCRHNVIRLWFPQLSTIVEHYSLEGGQNLCGLLDEYTGSLKVKSSSNSTSDICIPVSLV